MKLLRQILLLAVATLSAGLLQAGNLTVTLTPTQANSAGAQWRVDGGTWRNSGTQVKNLTNGSHLVEFKTISGWLAPAAATLTIGNGNTSYTGAYVQPGSLKITLTPANGRWRVDGGGWQTSGTTVGNLTPGNHSIGYDPLPSYLSPANENVSIVANQLKTLARSYTAVGTLLVTASPTSAATVGAAAFRIDGGAWQATGSPLTLSAGSHLLEFQPATGWIVPAASTITVTQGQTTAMTANYNPVHRLRFFLDPTLAAGLTTAELQNRIGQYAAHLQTIFHRESVRRFTFNPATDITLTSTTPFDGNYNGTLPEIGYEVWIHAVLTDNPAYGSYGGSGMISSTGAGGADGLYWDQIYDPSTLQNNTESLRQYWTQIDHITHELEHTFGAGVGEYYSPGWLSDPTNVEPILSQTSFAFGEAGDHFWGSRSEYWTDPLTVNIYDHPRAGNPTTLPDLLATVAFAPATKGVLASLHRGDLIPTVPDLAHVRVSVVDAVTGQAIPNATFRAWNRRNPGTFDIFEQTVTATATPGVFEFGWSPYPGVWAFGNWDNMKILKAWAPGYAPKAQWEWIYDAQKAKTVENKAVFDVTIRLTPQ